MTLTVNSTWNSGSAAATLLLPLPLGRWSYCTPPKEAFVKINSDYNDLLRIFDEFGVPYLIAGAYVVMKYTEPVWTTDMDVWVEPTPDNAAKALDALRSFGAPTSELTVGDFVDPETVFQIGVDGARIDTMTDVPGPQFEEAWNHQESFVLNDSRSPILSAEDTLKSAETANRPKDRARIRALKKAIQLRSKHR